MWSGRLPMSNYYRVEVSGWDTEEKFFVERVDLEWAENEGKRLWLSRRLRKGSIIFVRLLQATLDPHIYPIAYALEPTGEVRENLNEFRLRLVHPRVPEGSGRAN